MEPPPQPLCFLLTVALLARFPVLDLLARKERLVHSEHRVLPRLALGPDQRHGHGRTWLCCRFQQIKRLTNNAVLHIHIERLAAGTAQREVRKDEARYAAMLDDVARRANDDGGDAIFFQVSCNQTHGLVTDRSDGCHDGDVDPLVAAFLKHRRRRCIVHQLLAIAAIHIVKVRRDGANTAGLDILLQASERQVRVEVVQGSRIAVEAFLPAVQPVDRRVPWHRVDFANRRLFSGKFFALFAPNRYIRGRNKGYGALRQRLFKRREGHVFEMRPAVRLLIPLCDIVITYSVHITDMGHFTILSILCADSD